jgi:Ion channel
MLMSGLILHVCTIILLGLNFVTGLGNLLSSSTNINTDYSMFIEIANYVVYTFSSVGYGNAYPTDDVGMILAIIYMTTGLLMFSYIAARIKQYFDSTWDYAALMHTRSIDFEAWLAKLESNSPNSLAYYVYKGLSEHFDNFFRLDVTEVFNETYFAKLNPAAKSLIIESFSQRLSSLFPEFFKSVNQESWVPLLMRLKFRSYIMGTSIIKSHEIPPGLFFIVEGTATLNHPNDEEAEILHFKRGTYFGDPVILLESQHLHVK